MRINNCTTLFILSLLLLEAITIITTTTEAFVHVPNTIGSPVVTTKSSVLLFAAATKKKNNNKKKGGGGGFGISGTTKSSNNNGSSDGGTTTTSTTTTTAKLIAAADKNSLEQKWDAFASITDLEIKPIGNPEEDDNYDHFEVVDVFVRSGGSVSGSTTSSDDDNNSKASGNSNAGWYRIGKVCAIGIEYGGTTSIEAALVLQKGLILWTSVHMRRELMAKGSSAASSLELGYISPPILYMGCDTDKPIDEDEVQQYLKIVDKKLLSAEELSKVQSNNTYGFRPDWNPPGFTYKRREKAAMKKKNSNKKKTLEEILDE